MNCGLKTRFIPILVFILLSMRAHAENTAAAPVRSFEVVVQVTLSELDQTYDGTQKSVNSGNYWVTCTVTEPGLPASASGTLAVARADQTIAFDALAGRTLDDAPFEVSASSSSGLAVSFASATPDVCTISGATMTLVRAGTCTITANQEGNLDYNAAPRVSRSFAVAAAADPIHQLVAYDSALRGDWSLQSASQVRTHNLEVHLLLDHLLLR